MLTQDMMEKTKLLKNTTIYAIGDIIPKIISFITFPILTSYLSPIDYGIINYVNVINTLFLIIGFLCLNTYYLVHYYRVETENEKRNLLGNLNIFVISINFIFFIVFSILGYIYPNTFSTNINFYPYIFIGIVTNFFNLFSVLPSALYRVKENPLPLTCINVLKGVLTGVVTIILVVHYRYTALGVLYSSMFISIIFGIIFIIITIRNMNWYFSWNKIKGALQFSLPLLPGVLAYYILSMSDRFFIERYLGLEHLGIYSTAATFSLILNIISNGAYKAFEPYLFKNYNTPHFQDKFYQIRDYFLFAILLCAFGIAIFAKEFFILFASERYNNVYYYVPMILISVVLSSISLLYSTVVTAKGKTKINSMATILGGSMSFILNILLIPTIGLFGACIASFLSFITILALSVYFSELYGSIKKVFISFVIIIVSVICLVYLFPWTGNIYAIMLFKGCIFLFMSFLLCKLLKIKMIKFKL